MISASQFLRRRVSAAIREERGAAIVEFAIIFPVLIILLFGMIDFGRAFFLRNNLVAAAREGARFGSVMSDPCLSANVALIDARTRTYITNIGGTAPTAAQLVVTTPGACASGAGATTNVVVRFVAYPFTPITPVFRLINYSAALNINVSATYRWEGSTPL